MKKKWKKGTKIDKLVKKKRHNLVKNGENKVNKSEKSDKLVKKKSQKVTN